MNGVSTPHILGQIFQARFAWLKAAHGTPSIERVLASLTGADRERLRGVDREAWYPFATLLALDRAIARELGPGDEAIYEKLGEASSRERTEWLGEHAPLMSVHGFLARAAEDHRRFHTFGQAVYRRTGFDEGELEYTEYPEPSAEFCRTSVGYLRGALRILTGRDGAVRESTCQARGQFACLFHLAWTRRT